MCICPVTCQPKWRFWLCRGRGKLLIFALVSPQKRINRVKTSHELTGNLFFHLDDLGGLRPTSFRGRCFRLCHNEYWDPLIAFVICVNVIFMSLEHYRMSDDYRLLLDVNNYVCTGIFILEAFIKLSAVGWKCYFYDRYEGL